MTNDELEAVRARAEAATAGPWTFRPERGKNMGGFDGDRGATVCSFGDSTTYYPCEGEPPEEADATFIAHARTDIPALLDEVAEWSQAASVEANQRREAEARATRAEAHAERLAKHLAGIIAELDGGRITSACQAAAIARREALSAYRVEMKDG